MENLSGQRWVRAKHVLSLSPTKLRKLRKEGLIDSYFYVEGNYWLYDVESINAYHDARKNLLKEENGFKSLEGGAEMLIWRKTPKGHFRCDCGVFSLEERKIDKGISYYLDDRVNLSKDKKRTSRVVRDEWKRKPTGRKEAINMAWKMIMKKYGANGEQENSVAPKENGTMTFSEFVPIYLKEINNKKLRSARHIESLFRKKVEPFFGDLKLQEIRFRDVQKYRNDRQDEDASDASILNELRWARALFNSAVDGEYDTVRNPFKLGKLGLKNGSRKRYMSDEEQERLWPVLKRMPEPLFDMSNVELHTGMRPKNIDNLKWKQILLEERRIHIPKEEFKNENWIANFAIDDTVMEILERLKEKNPSAPDDYVFVREDEFGKLVPVKKDWRNKRWNEACREAGISDLRFYDLKHTLATRLHNYGMDIRSIQRLLNHANIQSTLVYEQGIHKADVEMLRERERISFKL